MYDINDVVVNDGWLAFMNGLHADQNPYHDDPEFAERWRVGWQKAEEYSTWKEKFYYSSLEELITDV